jgi:two-component system chemotaxis response regulator CheY
VDGHLEGRLKRILVVDDEPAIAHLIRASLKKAGLPCEVEYCSDGARVQVRAAEGRYDLITLDRNMPFMNGIDALKAIKRNSDLAGIPVVMITAQKDREFERSAIALGATAVLAKPFRPHDLATTLREMVCPEQVEAQTRGGTEGDGGGQLKP